MPLYTFLLNYLRLWGDRQRRFPLGRLCNLLRLCNCFQNRRVRVLLDLLLLQALERLALVGEALGCPQASFLVVVGVELEAVVVFKAAEEAWALLEYVEDVPRLQSGRPGIS